MPTKQKFKKNFVIDRSKWLNGTTDENPGIPDVDWGSTLHRPADGKECCLGIYLRSCRVSVADMGHHGLPSALELPKQTQWLKEMVESNILSGKVVAESRFTLLNDNKELGLKEREVLIKTRFADNGIGISYVGKYPNYAYKRDRARAARTAKAVSDV